MECIICGEWTGMNNEEVCIKCRRRLKYTGSYDKKCNCGNIIDIQSEPNTLCDKCKKKIEERMKKREEESKKNPRPQHTSSSTDSGYDTQYYGHNGYFNDLYGGRGR